MSKTSATLHVFRSIFFRCAARNELSQEQMLQLQQHLQQQLQQQFSSQMQYQQSNSNENMIGGNNRAHTDFSQYQLPLNIPPLNILPPVNTSQVNTSSASTPQVNTPPPVVNQSGNKNQNLSTVDKLPSPKEKVKEPDRPKSEKTVDVPNENNFFLSYLKQSQNRGEKNNIASMLYSNFPFPEIPGNPSSQIQETVLPVIPHQSSPVIPHQSSPVIPHQSSPVSPSSSSSVYNGQHQVLLPRETISDHREQRYRREEYRVTSNPILVCPDTFEFLQSGKTCIKEEKKVAELGCREGWAFDGIGSCQGVEAVPPEYLCSEGFKSTGKGCLMEEIAPKQTSCLSGFVISKTQRCIRLMQTEALPNCILPGYTLTPDRHRCVIQESVKPFATCPKGYHRPLQQLRKEHHKENVGDCIKEDEIPATPTCPKNYQLSNNQCLGIEEQLPSLKCRSGFFLEDDTCRHVQEISAEYQCPSKSRHTGSICEIEELIERTPICPEGYEEMPTHHGSIDCLKRDLKQPELSCPDGYYIDQNFCQKTKGRSRIVPQKMCPTGFHLAVNDISCFRLSSIEPELKGPCPKDSIEKPDKTCIKIQRLDATRYCLNGILNHNKCQIITIESPTILCQHGYRLKGNRCGRDIVLSPTQTCPPNYTLSEKNNCMKVQTYELTLECPYGFTIKHGNPPLCIGASYAAPRYECPQSYALTHTDNIPSHIQSFEEKIIEYVNPSNYHYQDITQVDDSLNDSDINVSPICEGKEEQPPQLSCPETYTDKGHKCVRFRTKPPTPICPKGFELSFTQCIKSIKEIPIVMCPVGFEFRGNGIHDIAAVAATGGVDLCINKIRTEPKPTCPNGYKYDTVVGVCYKLIVETNFDDPQESSLSSSSEGISTIVTDNPPRSFSSRSSSPMVHQQTHPIHSTPSNPSHLNPSSQNHHPQQFSQHHPQSLSQHHPQSLSQHHPQQLSQHHSQQLSQHHPQSLSQHHPQQLSQQHPQPFSQHHPQPFSQHHLQQLSQHHPQPFSQHHPQQPLSTNNPISQNPLSHHPQQDSQQHVSSSSPMSHNSFGHHPHHTSFNSMPMNTVPQIHTTQTVLPLMNPFGLDQTMQVPLSQSPQVIGGNNNFLPPGIPNFGNLFQNNPFLPLLQPSTAGASSTGTIRGSGLGMMNFGQGANNFRTNGIDPSTSTSSRSISIPNQLTNYLPGENYHQSFSSSRTPNYAEHFIREDPYGMRGGRPIDMRLSDSYYDSFPFSSSFSSQRMHEGPPYQNKYMPSRLNSEKNGNNLVDIDSAALAALARKSMKKRKNASTPTGGSEDIFLFLDDLRQSSALSRDPMLTNGNTRNRYLSKNGL